MRQQVTDDVDTQRNPRTPPARSRSAHPLADLQRTVGNRGVSALLQRRLAYGDDWGSLWGMAWATGAKETWTKLQPAFDERFMPVLARLVKMLETHAMSDRQREQITELNEQWGKFDSEKIPLAKGRELAATIDRLTEDVTALEKAVKSGLIALAAEIESQLDQVTGPFFRAYPSWGTVGIPGLDKANKDRKTLQGRLATVKSGQPVSPGDLDTMRKKAAEIAAVFEGAKGAAAAAEKTRQAERQKKDAEAAAPTKTAETETQPVIDKVLEKVANNRQQAAALRATGTKDDVLLDLLGRSDITAGRLAEVLRFCDASQVPTLLGLTTDAWLVRHFAAIRAKGKEAELAAILHLAPRQDADIEKLLTRTKADQLDHVRDLLAMFPAGATRASNAAALILADSSDQSAHLLALLTRVGVASAPALVDLLKHASPQELDFMIDPARGGHSFDFVNAELTQGHRIWAGATTTEPQCLMHDGNATTWANVLANAVMYHRHGFPDPETGRFSADRFGNHGGAQDMKLPTNTTYTEYDLREYTSEAERGTRRMVVGADGARYYTADHYRTFAKVS